MSTEILILCLVSACLGILSRSIIDNFRKNTGIIQLKMDQELNRPKMCITLNDSPLYKKNGTKYILRLQNDLIDEFKGRNP